MDKETKDIRRILVLFFWFLFIFFSAIRVLALFQCAWQLKAQGLPVDPLGNTYGVLTPLFGFPLNMIQTQGASTDSGLPTLLCYGIVLNSLILGLVAAGFLTGFIGGITLWATRLKAPATKKKLLK